MVKKASIYDLGGFILIALFVYTEFSLDLENNKTFKFANIAKAYTME